jgi:hypothetical protein
MGKLPDYDAEARVVYDRRHDFHESAGPVEIGRVGVSFGSEIFWTGSYYFPGTDMASYAAKVGFATEMARRWNAGRDDTGTAQ